MVILKREDERLDFKRTAKEVYDHIRSLNPSPLANIVIDGEEWKVLESKIGDNTNGETGTITNVYKDAIGIKCSDKEILITKINLRLLRLLQLLFQLSFQLLS